MLVWILVVVCTIFTTRVPLHTVYLALWNRLSSLWKAQPRNQLRKKFDSRPLDFRSWRPRFGFNNFDDIIKEQVEENKLPAKNSTDIPSSAPTMLQVFLTNWVQCSEPRLHLQLANLSEAPNSKARS